MCICIHTYVSIVKDLHSGAALLDFDVALLAHQLPAFEAGAPLEG